MGLEEYCWRLCSVGIWRRVHWRRLRRSLLKHPIWKSINSSIWRWNQIVTT